MRVIETVTPLGAVPFPGVAESQSELCALEIDQFNVPPPVLLTCRFWENGKEPFCSTLKLNERGESEITAGWGGGETV